MSTLTHTHATRSMDSYSLQPRQPLNMAVDDHFTSCTLEPCPLINEVVSPVSHCLALLSTLFELFHFRLCLCYRSLPSCCIVFVFPVFDYLLPLLSRVFAYSLIYLFAIHLT